MQKRKVSRARRKPRATTSEVVGSPQAQAAARIPRKHQGHYDKLLKVHEHLVTRQCDLSRDATEERPTFSQHMADAGTDTFDRDLALSMLSSEQSALYEVEQALDRIRNGTYGVCELTGKRIEPERLEAIPWTRFSAAAEKQLESEGVNRRRQLGHRENVPRESTAVAETED